MASVRTATQKLRAVWAVERMAATAFRRSRALSLPDTEERRGIYERDGERSAAAEREAWDAGVNVEAIQRGER